MATTLTLEAAAAGAGGGLFDGIDDGGAGGAGGDGIGGPLFADDVHWEAMQDLRLDDGRHLSAAAAALPPPRLMLSITFNTGSVLNVRDDKGAALLSCGGLLLWEDAMTKARLVVVRGAGCRGYNKYDLPVVSMTLASHRWR